MRDLRPNAGGASPDDAFGAILGTARPPKGWGNTVAVHNPRTGTTLVVDIDDARDDRAADALGGAEKRIQDTLHILNTVRENRQRETITIQAARQGIAVTPVTIALAVAAAAVLTTGALWLTPAGDPITPMKTLATVGSSLVAGCGLAVGSMIGVGVLRRQRLTARLHELSDEQYENAAGGLRRTSPDGKVNVFLATRNWLP